MSDRYGSFSANVSSPATRSTPIEPGAELNPIPKALLVGGAGAVVGQLMEDTEDRTFNLAAGYHPLRFRLIRSAGEGTTATGLVALD
ncbi:spike base protein, RCAP_Rcc01079 family [Sphingomonas panaciterrae]|uniref:spike base protein, RCAP_Rcc01079 family n=1 Tax=Sphingomonas panaciterrae TaxID=1462999 RepID=UPI002FEFC07A